MKIAIIGAGNMGGAIAKGLAQGTVSCRRYLGFQSVFVETRRFKSVRFPYQYDNRQSKSRRCCRLGDLGCETVVDRYGGEID